MQPLLMGQVHTRKIAAQKRKTLQYFCTQHCLCFCRISKRKKREMDSQAIKLQQADMKTNHQQR